MPDNADQAAFLGLAVRSLHLGFWRRAVTEVHYTVTDTLRQIYGVADPDQPFDRDLVMQLCHPDDLAKLTAYALLPEHPEDDTLFEYRIVTPAGDVKLLRVISSAERDAAGYITGHYGLIQDITQQDQLESQLRQAQKMEALGQLTGGIAHDFNNLLAVMRGNLELINRRVARGSQLAGFVAEGMRAVQRGIGLTQHLLAFGRMQVLTPVATDIGVLVTQMRSYLERLIAGNVVLKVALAPDLWRPHADATQLETAILNLVLNARDAMPDGGDLTIFGTNVDHWAADAEAGGAIAKDVLAPGEYVVIGVQDTGTGIEEAHLHRIFDPFFTTKETGKGTGLGLSMVYGFAAQSGGRLVIHSQLGTGTLAEIWLPRSRAAEPVEEVSPTVGAVGNLRILIVDDDVAVARTIATLLTDLGHETWLAASSEMALQLLATVPDIAVILSDMVLGGPQSGRHLVERLAADARFDQLPVILMSGYPQRDEQSGVALPPTVAFLKKPFTINELAGILRKVMTAASVRFWDNSL
jgi:signal transduction histidine kinase/CheY-like chemotaxis protein